MNFNSSHFSRPFILRMSLFSLLLLGLNSLPKQSATTLWFLLSPVAYLLSILSGTEILFESERGYQLLSFNAVIAPECSGARFLFICCILGTFLRNFDTPFPSVIRGLAFAYALAYLFTLLANAIRIFLLLTILKHIPIELQEPVHELVGSTTYFIFLTLFAWAHHSAQMVNIRISNKGVINETAMP